WDGCVSSWRSTARTSSTVVRNAGTPRIGRTNPRRGGASRKCGRSRTAQALRRNSRQLNTAGTIPGGSDGLAVVAEQRRAVGNGLKTTLAMLGEMEAKAHLLRFWNCTPVVHLIGNQQKLPMRCLRGWLNWAIPSVEAPILILFRIILSQGIHLSHDGKCISR